VQDPGLEMWSGCPSLCSVRGTPAWLDPEQGMPGSSQACKKENKESRKGLLKRIHSECASVDRCETCDRPSERGERRRGEETRRRTTPQSSLQADQPIRGVGEGKFTARWSAVGRAPDPPLARGGPPFFHKRKNDSALGRSECLSLFLPHNPPPPHRARPRRLVLRCVYPTRASHSSSTLLRSRLLTWFTRALSTTAATRDAPAPELKSSATPAPALAPEPKPEPKPKLELKDPSPADLQTRCGHSSDALHALLAHPALFPPLRRPRFPIVLCHGEQGRAARAACAELSA
jgi:hypothetical protein